jgi:hypothetical protein
MKIRKLFLATASALTLVTAAVVPVYGALNIVAAASSNPHGCGGPNLSSASPSCDPF